MAPRRNVFYRITAVVGGLTGLGVLILVVLATIGSTTAPVTKAAGQSFSIVETSPATQAADLVLPASKMNTKWSLLEPGVFVAGAADLATPGTCFPTDPLMSKVAKVQTEYSYNMQPNNTEGGHLTYAVLMAGSVEREQHQWQQIASPASKQCAIAKAQPFFAGFGKPAVSSVTSVTRTLPVEYIDYRVSANVSEGAGMVGHVSEETVFLQEGSAHVRLVFDNCGCKLGPPPDQDAIIAAAADALKAANPQ